MKPNSGKAEEEDSVEERRQERHLEPLYGTDLENLKSHETASYLGISRMWPWLEIALLWHHLLGFIILIC